MILIDPPLWPAHGTLFGHLVSDDSLDELHAFARAHDIPPRGFDHDHYDVPLARYDDLVDAGAVPTPSRELLARLTASGLRVRPHQRQPGRRASARFLHQAWDAEPLAPDAVRDDLLTRWSEPHRRYHDVRHLAQCLRALENLGVADPRVRIAAWFHDAVYEGRAGYDEEASADLASAMLRPHLPASDVAEVVRLVRLTVTHAVEPSDHRGAALVDADLSILAVSTARYHVYARDIRLEYAAVPEPDFVLGRTAVLERLLALDPLYSTASARHWTDAAHTNLAAERTHLLTQRRPLV